MKLLAVFSVLVAVAIAISAWSEYQPARQYRAEVVRGIMRHPHPTQDLYHVLPGEHCPAGYLRIPRAFSRAKNYWDGCWSGSHESDFTIDFLLRDEDAAIGVVVRERR
jgi:hypothetical protein